MFINRKHSEKTKQKMRLAKLKNPVRYWLGKGKLKAKLCKTCGVIFKSQNYNAKQKFCSKKCVPPWNKGKTGVQVSPRKGLTNCYSDETRKKMGLKNLGRKMSLEVKLKISKKLTRGNTPLLHAIRKSFLYRKWHQTIMTRDNYTCQNCNNRGGILQIDHHPIMFIELIKKNKIVSLTQALESQALWDIENGRTLCIDCHRIIGRKTPVYATSN